jgi:hypothetical protein
MNLVRIRLDLARTPDHPEGSPDHGYEFIAPLSSDNHIDPSAWKSVRERCGVIRFRGREKPEVGVLRHVGKGWRFDYDAKDDADDEPFFKLDRHSLTPGAYVSITEHDGGQRPFKVTSIIPMAN